MSDPIYDGYHRGLASMIYKFFDKTSSASGIAASLGNKSATEPNYHLPDELHKQIIRKFKKKKFIHLLETIFEVLLYMICNH